MVKKNKLLIIKLQMNLIYFGKITFKSLHYNFEYVQILKLIMNLINLI